jgi:pimeloyl-ACP methyl ester carboxylesterase
VSAIPPAAPHAPRHRRWTEVDWREHQRWVRVHGRWTNVIEAGEGPPLVLVHGLGGSWRNWLETIPAFMGDRRVLAMDLPGFGASEMPARRISIPGYGRWLETLCEQLDVGTAPVIGSSMGGLITAELAIQVPERVERLGLIAAAGLTVQRPGNGRLLALVRRGRRALRLYVGAAALVAARSDAFARRPALRRLLLARTIAHPERLGTALAAEQLRGAGKPGFLDALEAVMDYAIRERLPGIACPTLIVWGDHDRMIPVGDADDFERLIRDTRKLIYHDVGHGPMLERPARFNADLRAFLDERPGDGRVGPGATARGADRAPGGVSR